MVFTTPLVGLLPPGKLRRFCGQMIYKITFRTMIRGISGVVRYHDQQYKPTSTGLCVANHTTTIDVAVLSCNHTYSMVGCFFLNYIVNLGLCFSGIILTGIFLIKHNFKCL